MATVVQICYLPKLDVLVTLSCFLAEKFAVHVQQPSSLGGKLVQSFASSSSSPGKCLVEDGDNVSRDNRIL